jgi:thiol-disulfide isomerase/thioredoxin
MLRCASLWLLLAELQAALAQGLPMLALPDLHGQSHTLQEWHGKVILLNFWASWCGPCLTEIPHLADYQRRYAQEGLQVVGIGLDQPTKLANVVRTLKVPYPVLHAPLDRAVELLYQWGDRSGALPYTAVIGRDGTLLFRHVGELDEALIQELIAR